MLEVLERRPEEVDIEQSPIRKALDEKDYKCAYKKATAPSVLLHKVVERRGSRVASRSRYWTRDVELEEKRNGGVTSYVSIDVLPNFL